MINKRKRGQEQARAELLSDNSRFQDMGKKVQANRAGGSIEAQR